LDIDIYRNEPRVLEHTKVLNTSGFIGTTVRVLIAGNWTTYKSRIVQYIQQLAIITPYAELSMTFTESTGKRDIHLVYHRRSEQIPDMPTTVKHHPSSVNNIIIQQLIQQTKTTKLVSFLTKELQSISPALAKRLIAELEESADLNEDMHPNELSDKQITRLVQLFHKVLLFRPPDGGCLSPLGEYNLKLGIHKVLEPDYIATTRDKVSVYEGHPFLIEAAVSLGGNNTKEGVTVYRFANRIPLLFEGGADVATRVALTKVKWSNYKIDYKRDKVGVFVSIVSTKIPFKGTSKEYIGDDGTSSSDSTIDSYFTSDTQSFFPMFPYGSMISHGNSFVRKTCSAILLPTIEGTIDAAKCHQGCKNATVEADPVCTRCEPVSVRVVRWNASTP
jgi:DNA topoisomerase VI B subunit